MLPNSRLRIGYATSYHDWEHGCSLAQVLVCYLPNYSPGVAAGSLVPTLPVSWSFEDYLNGRDTALETILEQIDSAQATNLPEGCAWWMHGSCGHPSR